MPSLDDTLDAIDTALGSCTQCGTLRDGSPSDDFCSEHCQRRWMRSHTTDPGTVLFTGTGPDPALIASLISEAQIRAHFEAIGRVRDTVAAMSPALTEAARGMAASFARLGEFFQQVQVSLNDRPRRERRSGGGGWDAAFAAPGELPAERALRLQRTRNTGPRSNPFPKRGIT